jgi:hypothetical protein
MPLPILIPIAVVVVSALLAYRSLRKKSSSFSNKAYENVVLEIKVPRKADELKTSDELKTAPIASENMFASLHGLLKMTPEDQEQFSFEIESSPEGIRFYVAVPPVIRSFIESQIYAQYPDATIKECSDYVTKRDRSDQVFIGAEITFSKRCNLSIKSSIVCSFHETYITMENGVSKKIEEVSVGDRVLTHTGQVKEVKEVFVGDVKEEKLRNLKIAGINQRLCYSRTHQFQVWSEKDQNWEWQFISDIKEGDYLRSVHFNMEEKESDPSGAMVLGYFIGHLDSLKILDNKNLRFTISSRKSNIALETILKVSELMLEEQIQFEMTPVKDSESVYIHIKNDKLVKFLKDNILEEGLIKSHWLSMNPEDSKIFVENLFKSRTSVKLSDIRIAEQLYYIVSRSGMTPWINAKQKNLNIDLDLVKSYKQESYQITLGKKSSLISTKVAPDGSLMRRVENIKEEIYTGQLFDLHVDEDFSYVAGNVVAHNAFGLQSHLKSGAKVGLVHVEINATANDRIARHCISQVQQQLITIYGEANDWDNENSLVKELVKLQRLTTSGDPPRIRLVAPSTQGSHDDQYSSFSRSLWAANEGRTKHPVVLNTGASRYYKARSSIIQDRVESIQKSRNLNDRQSGNRNPFLGKIRRG